MSIGTIVSLIGLGVSIAVAVITGVYKFGILKNDTDRNKEEIDELKRKVDNEVKDLYTRLEEKFDKLDLKIETINTKIESKFERMSELLMTVLNDKNSSQDYKGK